MILILPCHAGLQSYAISIAPFVDPTSNGLSRVFRTFLPSPSEMIVGSINI